MKSDSTAVLVVLAHGYESAPWGSKIRPLADIAELLGAAVHRARLQLLNADHRLNSLQRVVGRLRELFLQRVMGQVNSSSAGKGARYE